MISQQSTSTLGSLKQGAGRWRMVAGGAILAVVVVGAIGVWQLRAHSTPSTAHSDAAAPAVAAASTASGADALARELDALIAASVGAPPVPGAAATSGGDALARELDALIVASLGAPPVP